MPLPQLPKEVWTTIASYGRKSLGRPRDVKDRKEVRQVDLVNMMCVSKADIRQTVHNATAPVLYHTILTDDLAALFSGFDNDQPVCPGVFTKKQLLHFVRALYLEYPIREPPEDYNITLMMHVSDHHNTRTGDWFGGIGSFYSVPQIATLVDCHELFVKKPATQLQHSMPDLEILSCGAYFGSYIDGWCSNFVGTMDYRFWVGDIQKVFTRMFLESKIKHFCQSSNYSPMCIHPVELNSHQPAPPIVLPTGIDRTITLHASLKSFKGQDFDKTFTSSSSLPGAKVRWCFDEPRPAKPISNEPFLGFTTAPLMSVAVFVSMASGLGGRDERKTSDRNYQLQPLSVDAYIPITDAAASMMLKGTKQTYPRGLDAGEKQTIKRQRAAVVLEEAMSNNLFHTDVDKKLLHPEDHLGIKYIADCPACPACDWRPIV